MAPSSRRHNNPGGDLFDRIVGLGEKSARKSYYAQLQNKIGQIQRFGALVDQTNDLILVIGCGDCLVADANRSACAVLGRDKEELIGLPLTDIFVGESRQHILGFTCATCDPGTKLSMTTAMRTRSGAVFPAEVILTRVGFEGAPFTVLIGRDITKRVAAEAALLRAQQEVEQNRNLLQKIIDSAPIPISYLDTDLRYVIMNEAYAAMTGHPREQSIGHTLSEVLPDDAAEQIKNEIGKSLCGEYRRFTVSWKDPETGERRTYIKICAPNIDEGRVKGIVSTHTDVTDLLDAKEAAEAANKVKSEFLANMSHEMRTPLAGVLGMIDLVLDMNLEEEARQLLTVARQSGETLLRLLTDLLQFSRLEAGRLAFDYHEFDVARCIEEAVNILDLSARKKNLVITRAIDPEVPHGIVGDAGRVRQVLINLIGNAVKFSHRGTITVAVKPEQNDTLLFSVTDEGIGIPPEQLPRLFNKFVQVDQSSTRKYGGSGLGLALSRQIVEKMGGRIWVESTVGQGSTFFFTLPTRLER